MAQRTQDRGAPARTPFDTRPAQVETWVASLPLTNLGETSRLLFEALNETNGADMPVEQRFRMLELFSAPLRTVVEGMKIHFVGKPFPLGDKGRQIIQLTQTLMNLMAAGYRQVVEASAEKRGCQPSSRRMRSLLATNTGGSPCRRGPTSAGIGWPVILRATSITSWTVKPRPFPKL